MKKSRFSEEQILYALRQAESGTPPADVCRQLGCSEAAFYIWKKRYGNLGLSEVKELRQLRDENARLISLDDARYQIERWRIDYNESRPHSSLGNLTPSEFAMRCQDKRTSGASKL